MLINQEGFMKSLKKLLFVLMLISLVFADQFEKRPVNTYSIVAYDPATGQLGVAVQSHWFAVGQLVPWAKAGVGAVATQSFVKVEYGPEGLKMMEKGKTANEALDVLLQKDEGREVRQVAMIDTKGNIATHTGRRCVQMAGHYTGDNYSVQANMMENKTVWPAMAKAYENTSGDLANRMMAALEAAQAEGGDIRGKQSAAMLIVSGEPTGKPWQDKIVDLRVDDHPEPLKQLKRLIRINRAYQHANQGDKYLEQDKISKAQEEYKKAEEYYPENPELPYWTAITLAGEGKLEKALPIFKEVFAKNPKLKKMTPRLVEAGLLPDDEELLDKIMSVGD